MPQWLVIGISGVTCGGKTTLAHSLRDYFQGLRGALLWNTPYTIGEVQLISQDDYFLPVDDRRHKWIDKLNAINFELITSLDMKQMLADIEHIIKGPAPEQPVEYVPVVVTYANFEHYAMQFQQQYHQQQQQHPSYNSNYYPPHHNGKPMGYQYQPQPRPHHPHQQQQQHRMHHVLHPNAAAAAHIMHVNAQIAAQLRDKKVNVLLIEGLMIFNQPELLALCNLKYHFHLPYEKCYERRRQRTYDPPDVTGYFELCVWPHYEKNFSEFRDCKQITFLNGEISKEKIFKYVLQRIGQYFEERSEGNAPTMSPVACPPPQKLMGMLGVGVGLGPPLCNGPGNSNNNLMPKACPMEQ